MSLRRNCILQCIQLRDPLCDTATAYAPVNIALIKYWGKRNKELHLPVTDSVSLSLSLGTHTSITHNTEKDEVYLNGRPVDQTSTFFLHIQEYLSLIRPHEHCFFSIHTHNDIPTAAGLASSASGWAALVKALDLLFGWQLTAQHLSILARLGSGSACRSIFEGCVQWHAGQRDDGMDSYAHQLPLQWPTLCMGIAMISTQAKPFSSREAMDYSLSSPLYTAWPTLVHNDLITIQHAFHTQDFMLFGNTIERNALAMHAMMHTSTPPLCYWTEESVAMMHTIWHARRQGLQLFFTMDAGPNLKLFFQEQDKADVYALIPSLQATSLTWGTRNSS